MKNISAKLYQSIGNVLHFIISLIASNVADLLLLFGFSIVIYGIYLIYYPLSFIIGGAGIIIFAFSVAHSKEGDGG